MHTYIFNKAIAVITFTVLFVLLLFSEKLYAQNITGLRDSVVWIRSANSTGEPLNITWQDWYASDSNTNYIYFQAPDGSLINIIKLSPGNSIQSSNLAFSEGTGDYRLEVPGYSHRLINIETPPLLPVVIEPAKFHFSLHADNSVLYFNVPAGTHSFSLCGCYHGGAEAIQLFDPNGKLAGMLSLTDTTETLFFDSLKVDTPMSGSWRIQFQGKGKVSFWVDGIQNYFAFKSQDLFIPEQKPGLASFTGDGRKEPMGKIGASLVLTSEDQRVFSNIDYMGLNSFNYYINHRWREPHNEQYPSGGDNDDPNIINWQGFAWEDDRIKYYRHQLGAQISSIFNSGSSWLGIPLTPDKQKEYAEFALAYITHFNEKESYNMLWFSPWDEPNLKEFTYEEYASVVSEIGRRLNSADTPSAIKETHLMAISSSGFENTNAGVDRVGKDWAEKIYSQYDEYVDGIAFDYWDRKDLIELWRFNSAVSMAAEIIRSNDSDNNQKEEIVINQTSMSPGTSSSPYDVNTHFSALWLVGAICNAFSSGELDAFHYFTTVDDERHMKGLMYSDQVPSALPYQQKASPYELKPMGHAMAMINQTIQEEVVILNSDSLEVDALLTIDTQGNTLSLIVGNKFNRINKLDIQVPLPEIMWNKKLSVSAKKLNATMKQPDYHTIKTNIFTKTNFIFSHELEPETIYSFHFTRLSSSLEPPAYFKLGVEPL